MNKKELELGVYLYVDIKDGESEAEAVERVKGLLKKSKIDFLH